MPHFRFTLQRVLEVAGLRADLAQQELARAQRTLELRRQELAVARERVEQIGRLLARRRQGKLSIEEILGYERFLERLQGFREQVEALVVQAEEQVEEARLRAVELMQRRKSLDGLRERQLEHHLAEVRRAEQKELDEMASRRMG
ncbi:MAG: flagellar export protein FliJ [Bacillota bacterium]